MTKLLDTGGACPVRPSKGNRERHQANVIKTSHSPLHSPIEDKSEGLFNEPPPYNRLRTNDPSWIDIDLNRQASPTTSSTAQTHSPPDAAINRNRHTSSSDRESTFQFPSPSHARQAKKTAIDKKEDDSFLDDALKRRKLGRKYDPASENFKKDQRRIHFDTIWDQAGLGLHHPPRRLATKILQTDFGNLTGKTIGQHVYRKLKEYPDYHAEYFRQKLNLESRMKYAKKHAFDAERLDEVYEAGYDGIYRPMIDQHAHYRAEQLGNTVIRPYLESKGLNFDTMTGVEIMMALKDFDLNDHVPVLFFKEVYQLLRQTKGATERDISRYRQIRKQFRNAVFNSRRKPRARTKASASHPSQDTSHEEVSRED